MPLRALSFLLLLPLAGSLSAQDALPPAAPPYYRVRYEPSTQPGELVYAVSYTVWIPPGVTALRGIIVHQHGCGEGACKAGQTAAFDLHWQALAKKHDCALLGPSFEQPEKADCSLWCDPRNGSEKRFLQALDDLSKISGHPELARVPWALWGHSGGAVWVGTMLLLHPDRIAADWLRSGTPRLLAPKDSKLPALEIPAAALIVPVMCNLGTKEGVTIKDPRFGGLWEKVKTFFLDFRAKGGLIAVSADPHSSHDCGDQRYLAIPWFDVCLAARLGKSGEPLKPMPTDGAWLAPLLGEAAQPAAEFKGDAKSAVWLPNERAAKAWVEYVKDARVSDSSPPPAPTHIKFAGNELTWEAEADIESGLAGFIIERDGQELARLPEKPSSPFGRPIFQKNSYSDTPSQPLVQMRYVDAIAKAGEQHVYRVISVNTVGLKSEAATLNKN